MTTMKCAKMAEPINVPFGMWTRVGPTSHALGGGPDFSRGRSSWGAFPGIVAFRYNSLTTCSLTQLVGRQEGHPAYKKTEWWGAGVVICLERGADLHTAQLMPLPLTVFCFSKIQIGFTFLVPAHPGSP